MFNVNPYVWKMIDTESGNYLIRFITTGSESQYETSEI